MLCGTQAEVREERKKLTTQRPQKFYKQLLESEKIHLGKEQSADLRATIVHSPHLMLHAALERAVKEQLIPRNPTEACVAPKPRKIKMQILPSEDIHAYLEAAKARDLLPGAGPWPAERKPGGPAKDAVLPHIRFHDLRHAFAITALQNGVDVKKKAHQTGSASCLMRLFLKA